MLIRQRNFLSCLLINSCCLCTQLMTQHRHTTLWPNAILPSHSHWANKLCVYFWKLRETDIICPWTSERMLPNLWKSQQGNTIKGIICTTSSQTKSVCHNEQKMHIWSYIHKHVNLKDSVENCSIKLDKQKKTVAANKSWSVRGLEHHHRSPA